MFHHVSVHPSVMLLISFYCNVVYREMKTISQRPTSDSHTEFFYMHIEFSNNNGMIY